MVRIEGSGISTQLNPFGPNWNTPKVDKAATVAQQVQAKLFGHTKPALLDPANFPELAAMIAQLYRYKRKLAVIGGDEDEDYIIVLADGTIGMIDEFGVIYLGAKLLHDFGDKLDVIVGVLAHEIGHRPKRWQDYISDQELSQEQIEELCRHEETRADIFAGKALAELGLSCEPLIEFLQNIEDKPHPEYFEAKVRGEVIREAFSNRSCRVENRRKTFPEFDRMTSPKGHLGEV
ncbi:MAG: hypothetical protein JW841_06850 [Deltaproteobacteria bacterium]|nr:hypothetical protein [Deltaproteobacteria bacterium]